MKQLVYLTRIKTCGIKNIEQPVEIEFYKKTINNDFNPEKYKIKGIYGENGSGKTAIIQSVKMLSNFILDKSYLSNSDTQKNLLELINKRTRKGFVEAEYFINLEKIKYIFKYYISFELQDDERIYIDEELFDVKRGNYSKNKFEPFYRTKKGELIHYIDEELFPSIKEKTLNLLDRQTFISTVMSSEGFMNQPDKNDFDLVQILLAICGLAIMVYIDAEDSHTNYLIRKKINELEEREEQGIEKDFINHLKNDVFKIGNDEMLIPKKFFSEYEKKISRLADFIRIFKPELEGIEIETKDHDEFYKCNLKMIYQGYTLDREFESRGIKKLMELFNYLDAASQGVIVFIDELDANINDVYLDKIIEYFIYYGKGQLCFTAHNLSPMSILKNCKNAITFISGINTVHTWTKNGNLTPENAYKNGFIEDSPFNVDASDFLGILGGDDE